MPIELLINVMAMARRRMNHELASTMGECMNPAENASEIRNVPPLGESRNFHALMRAIRH